MLELIFASVFGTAWLIATVLILCSLFSMKDGLFLRLAMKVVPPVVVVGAFAFLGLILMVIGRAVDSF